MKIRNGKDWAAIGRDGNHLTIEVWSEGTAIGRAVVTLEAARNLRRSLSRAIRELSVPAAPPTVTP